jgi:ketosteroid isomerase-like protein
MSVQLPKPIEMFIAAENSGDTGALADCLAADAVVRDEGRTFEGPDAIAAWMAGTKAKYAHRIEPIDAVARDGATVVTGTVSGNFPGSPANLKFVFVLKGDRIASLDIR